MPKKKTTEPAPSTGHNSAGVTAEMFNKWWARIERADAKCKIANDERVADRKQARADGIKLTEFDAMRKVAGLPRIEAIEKLTAARDYLIFMHSPLGAQMTMDFDAVDPLNEDDKAARVRIEADAETDGYRAGLAGVKWEKDNPHEPLTPEGQAWIKGYRDGQTNRAEALGDEANTGA